MLTMAELEAVCDNFPTTETLLYVLLAFSGWMQDGGTRTIHQN